MNGPEGERYPEPIYDEERIDETTGPSDTEGDGGLVDFIAAVAGEGYLKVDENFGDGYVRLRTAEAERRQAKHDIRGVEDIVIEMLRNARDAGASRIFLATTRDEEGPSRYLTFIDDGSGIPAHMHRLIFEPRVTSKLDSMVVDRWGVHGRGMALYSISANTRRSFVVTSGTGLGSSLFIDVDLNQLPEKRDQSTYPELVRDEDGALSIARGPHNIIRNVLEFALEQRDVDVFYGSPTEIANVMCHIGQKELTDTDLLFCDDINTLPVCYRIAACGDAEELSEMSTSLGLPISIRTAHRVLSGDLPLIKPALAKIMPTALPKPVDVDVMKDRRGLKISPDDIDGFSITMERAFDDIARKYYISLKEMPKVTVTKDSIRVRFDIEKDD